MWTPAMAAMPGLGGMGWGAQPPSGLPPIDPKPHVITMQDPRPSKGGQPVGVIAFYYPDRLEDWDKICGGSFMGNFYDMSPEQLQLTDNRLGTTHSFKNAEAAFQALKFWNIADQFTQLTGDQAFKLKQSMAGQEDRSYGGFGNNFVGMYQVLKKKFDASHPRFVQGLLATGEAYLLEHNAVKGRDTLWSDDSDGQGNNWLGTCLMVVRDELSGANQRPDSWTAYISSLMNLGDGSFCGGPQEAHWRTVVGNSYRALVTALAAHGMGGGPFCMTPGCGKPTWNRQANEYCSKSCRPGSGTAGAVCTTPGCGKPSWNRQPNEYCSKSCRPARGPASGGYGGGRSGCPTPGCGKPSWNGKPNEYCSKGCKSSQPRGGGGVGSGALLSWMYTESDLLGYRFDCGGLGWSSKKSLSETEADLKDAEFYRNPGIKNAIYVIEYDGSDNIVRKYESGTLAEFQAQSRGNLPQCSSLKCNKPSWRGKQNEHCSKECQSQCIVLLSWSYSDGLGVFSTWSSQKSYEQTVEDLKEANPGMTRPIYVKESRGITEREYEAKTPDELKKKVFNL